MHIHDDLQDVIAQDTETYGAAAGSAAFKTSLNRRFGSYRLVRNGRSVQQNLQHRLSAVSTSSPGFKPETPVCPTLTHLILYMSCVLLADSWDKGIVLFLEQVTVQ